MNKIITIQLVSLIFLSFFPGDASKVRVAAAQSSGVDIAYEVNVSAPPDSVITVRATFTNVASPFRLQIGYEGWSVPSLSVLKGLEFSSPEGAILTSTNIDSRTIEVTPVGNSVIAKYEVDLTQTDPRAAKVSSIGGSLSGYEVFPTPSNQTVNSVRVKFTLPDPWTAISSYPIEGNWFVVKPFTFQDLSLETKASGWDFGNVDFDQTKTYPDGFAIRVVGFKYFPYEHWNVYSGDTPLEEALKSADFYYETYLKLKQLYGEFPLPKILLVGPGYWQSGSNFVRQQLVGWYRYEYVPHHMLHAYFGIEGSRIIFSERFYSLLREGYPTYSEGIMTAAIAGNPIWRGMLYERKFHYLRGPKFNNMQQNSSQYVFGFIVTYLMDKEIRSETNGQKGIDDLMVRLWQKYQTPNSARVSDEQVLETLAEITGNDWHGFYTQNVVDTSHLNVDALDDLKGDFNTFLKADSDQWYSGYSAMYFIGQEIVSAVGDFDQNVRMQAPFFGVNIGNFVVAARQYKAGTSTDLTESDVETILHQVTGKDHSDFFDFYRNQGFEVDVKEINEYIKAFSFVDDRSDNAVRLYPNTFLLGKTTMVTAELVDSDFATAKELSLQVQVYDNPIGLSKIQDLIAGQGVSYQFSQPFSGGAFGSGANHFFSLPITTIGNKTYTHFTINLPQDAGVMLFSFGAKNAEPITNNWLGGFIGTKKVSFQSESSFCFKVAKDTFLPLILR